MLRFKILNEEWMHISVYSRGKNKANHSLVGEVSYPMKKALSASQRRVHAIEIEHKDKSAGNINVEF